MLPLWIAAVFLALVTFYTGQDMPRKEAVTSAVVSDVSATNFLAYRSAARAYLAANPGASGVIDDAALSPYWLPGYNRNPLWTNLVQGGTLFVYATAATERGTVHRLFELTKRSVLVGTKNASTGRLMSGMGLDTGINLPAAIPDGAVVMIGS